MKNVSVAEKAPPTPRRFSTLLVFFVLASALPLMALSVALVTLSALQQRQQVLDGLQATARGFQLAVDREIDVTVAALQALATSPAIDAALVGSWDEREAEGFRAQAFDLVARRPGALHNIALYATPDGARVADALGTGGGSGDAPEIRSSLVKSFDPNALLDAVARTRRPYVSDMFHNPEADRPLVSAGVPVLRGERVVGVLAADLKPEGFGEILRASVASEADRVAVVDGAGVIMARSHDATSFVGQLAVDDIREFQNDPDSVSAVFQTETVDGRLVYGALHRLADAPWTVVYGAPRGLVDGPVRRELLVSGVAGGLALGFFLLVASWQGRRLGQEIATLGADATAIGQGHLPAPRVERVQEVASVRAALLAGVAALAASEERLRLATDGAGMATWDLDLDTGEMVLSDQGYRMLGLDPQRAATLDLWLAQAHPDERSTLEAEIEASEAQDRVLHAVHRIRRRDDGEERWIETYGRHLRSGHGTRRLTGVSFDVTERRLSEARQTLLVREVDHRAKNVLAVVQAILRLTRVDDPEIFAASVEGRVQALARAHELLARDRWQGAGLRPLAAQELAAEIAAGRAVLEGPDLQLRPEAVQPLAMVLHEFVTDALRHGALSAPEGAVRLSWDLDPDSGALRLRWVERGGPRLRAPPRTTGFGSRMMKATIEVQLGGKLERRWRPEGLECDITVAGRFVASVAVPTAKGTAAAAAPPQEGRLSGRRVLLAEDEALIAADLTRMLTRVGCEVLGPGATVAEAQTLAASVERIDAAVLDLNLLGESSLSLAEALVERGVPVVVVTGYDELPAEWERRVRVLGFLRKPVDPGELQAALARATASGARAEGSVRDADRADRPRS